MTYQFEVEIPDWPVGYYIGIAVAAWYLFAYVVVRILARIRSTSKDSDDECSMEWLMLWVGSPMFAPFFLLIVAAWATGHFLFPSAPRKEKK